MEFGLIGEKLGHSYSKIIHEKLADYRYDLCPLSKEEFKNFMLDKKFRGINVTIPYKREVLPYIDVLDEKAKRIGAVNTIVNRNNKLYGYNTDYDGFYYTLKKHKIDVSNRKVLVLGNGGASLAILAVLEDCKASPVLTVKYKEEANTITYEQAALEHKDAYLIVNTSPVGMYPKVEESPMDLTPYKNLHAVIDIIYNPAVTKLMKQAMDNQILAVNGLEMLVAQASYAVEYFIDTKIKEEDMEDVIKNMKL